jgi:hypothetical protein
MKVMSNKNFRYPKGILEKLNAMEAEDNPLLLFYQMKNQ